MAKVETTIHKVVDYDIKMDKHLCDGSFFWVTAIQINDAEGNTNTIKMFAKEPLCPNTIFNREEGKIVYEK